MRECNILVSSSGLVKVMDFGVARADFEREAETQSLMFGTQRYMAPERWLEGECGHRSDVFSLGVAFWELVTGEKFAQVPFAPGHFERRIAESVEQFLGCVSLEGREEATAVHALKGMLAYRASDRLDANEVREIMGELSELAQGPSLRRYARRRVAELVEIQQAMLAGDKELKEFTGTLKTASSAKYEESCTVGTIPGRRRCPSRGVMTPSYLPQAALQTSVLMPTTRSGICWARRQHACSRTPVL